MLMFKVLFCFFFCLTVSPTFCQNDCDYLLQYNTDSAQRWKSFVHQQHSTEVNEISGNYKDQKKLLLNGKLKAAMEHFDTEELVTDSAVNNYVAQVLYKLSTPLKLLPNVKIFVSRSGTPNAFTPGYHSVFINAGLLTKVRTEAQLAFIICHELAHIYLKHSEQAIDQYLSSINSSDFKGEVKNIKKQEFRKGQAVKELTQKYSFDFRKHSRFKETSADSLAIRWLQHSEYSNAAAIEALTLLDVIDQESTRVKEVFEQYLSFPEYPHKPERFGALRKSIFGAAAFNQDEESKKISDSLKTHPDCKERIAFANNLIANNIDGHNFLVDSLKLSSIQHKLKDELVAYSLKYGKTSRALYHVIDQLGAEGLSASIAIGISQSFNQLYAAQKTHTLGKTTDLPNPQIYSKPYNELLYFIQHATLKDLASIGYYFTHASLIRFPDCKPLMEAMLEAATFMEKPEEAAKWKTKLTNN